MHLVSDRQIQLFYSSEILDEYRRVLAYERLNIKLQTQESIIAAILRLGILIEPIISNLKLPDETDRIFYDTAKASDAILITGNSRHYPSEIFIMTPYDFLLKLEKEEQTSNR